MRLHSCGERCRVDLHRRPATAAVPCSSRLAASSALMPLSLARNVNFGLAPDQLAVEVDGLGSPADALPPLPAPPEYVS